MEVIGQSKSMKLKEKYIRQIDGHIQRNLRQDKRKKKATNSNKIKEAKELLLHLGDDMNANSSTRQNGAANWDEWCNQSFSSRDKKSGSRVKLRDSPSTSKMSMVAQMRISSQTAQPGKRVKFG